MATDEPLDLDALAEAVAKMRGGEWSVKSGNAFHFHVVAASETDFPYAVASFDAQSEGEEYAEAIVLLRNSAEQLIALARRTQHAEARSDSAWADMRRAVAAGPEAERDTALARCAELEVALSAAREELSKWGWGDMHYGNDAPQERRVVVALEAIDRSLARSDADTGDTKP